MHTMNSESQFAFKCPIRNCHSSFDRQGHLDTHIRVHNNDFADCQYCPYRYTKPDHYKIHLKVLVLCCPSTVNPVTYGFKLVSPPTLISIRIIFE